MIRSVHDGVDVYRHGFDRKEPERHCGSECPAGTGIGPAHHARRDIARGIQAFDGHTVGGEYPSAPAWIADGIRVNVLAPGTTVTPMTEVAMANPEIAALMDENPAPIARWAQPPDIAEAARWGGLELGSRAVVELVSAVAEGDGASGWVFGLLASHFWLGSVFDLQAQYDMWGDDPDALMSSSFAAEAGEVAACDGGYRVSGRWPFSSGFRPWLVDDGRHRGAARRR